MAFDKYKKAGVDLESGRELTRRLRRITGSSNIGAFAATTPLPGGYKKPVVVTACDGVGTKLALLAAHDRLEVAGWDLVAMCTNDLACTGAAPWLLLDYYGCSKLDVDAAQQVMCGIAKACENLGCELVGGETAELPGLIAQGKFDLAGFALGLVEQDDMLAPSLVREGDTVLGIRTKSLHCNGFSLVRKILDETRADMSAKLADGSLGELLLTPAPLYAKAIVELVASDLPVKACAHITGGGMSDNLARALPEGLGAQLQADALALPSLHSWLQDKGQVSPAEMAQVFNSGIGMAVIVAPDATSETVACLAKHGHKAEPIGSVTSGESVEVA